MTIEVLAPLIACISMLLIAIVIGIVIFLRESKKQDAYRRTVNRQINRTNNSDFSVSDIELILVNGFKH